MINMRTSQFNTFKASIIALLVVLYSGFFAFAHAQEQKGGLDTIAAIVNNDVITMRTVIQETESIKREFSTQNIPLPDDETLQKQRSEEHTSELQSRGHLVCRLLLEKKKKQ